MVANVMKVLWKQEQSQKENYDDIWNSIKNLFVYIFCYINLITASLHSQIFTHFSFPELAFTQSVSEE